VGWKDKFYEFVVVVLSCFQIDVQKQVRDSLLTCVSGQIKVTQTV
jgi:hypothetical protein